MTITEFAIVVFKSPPNFSDPPLQPLFQTLSAWQSQCSGFPLLFFINPDGPLEVHLVSGWASVEAHEAWIQGERNQELIRMLGPYIDMQKVRMVHVDVDFEAISKAGGGNVTAIERYDGESVSQWEGSNQPPRTLVGRDLARDGGDVYVFHFGEVGEAEATGGGRIPIERWVLKRAEL